jgi:hypothetical protein
MKAINPRGLRARITRIVGAALVAGAALSTGAEAATLVGIYPGNDPFGGQTKGLYGSFGGRDISSPSLAKCDVSGRSCDWENGAVQGEDYTSAFALTFDGDKSGSWSFTSNPSRQEPGRGLARVLLQQRRPGAAARGRLAAARRHRRARGARPAAWRRRGLRPASRITPTRSGGGLAAGRPKVAPRNRDAASTHIVARASPLGAVNTFVFYFPRLSERPNLDARVLHGLFGI